MQLGNTLMMLSPEMEIDFLPYSSVIYIELTEHSETKDGVEQPKSYTVKSTYNGKPLKTCPNSEKTGVCSSEDFVKHIEKYFYTDYS